jgi:putative two-component system response regulator
VDERPVHVFAIDDDPGALAVVEAACTLAGMEFSSTIDPREAVERVLMLEPDVVLLDVMMPGVDGFEICRRLKSNSFTELIPVVLVTALESREDRLQGIQSGCDDFLNKPLDRIELTARVRSLARVRRVTENLDDAVEVLKSLARTVEAKDPTTGDHCDRLSKQGRSFGLFLNLPDVDIKALSQAGILHDIGKVGIPDAILFNPGALDIHEWAVMKQHVTIGANLLQPLRTMSRVLPIVRHHHEKWNGTGYPDGLAGDNIPYLARVFSILDAWDALTSERPYKRAFSEQETLEILLKECDEGKWDPELIDQFQRFLNE